MSSADPEEVSVEIEREGVTVEKSFEPDDFPVPAIAFVIRSERDVPVDVKLVDTVPEDIQAEDIGFHPKYGAEHWRNEGEELIFERTFEAGEEYTTVYGLRARDTEDVGRFLGDPELAEVSPPKDSSEVVRDVMGESGQGSAPGTSDDDLEAAIAAADVDDTSEGPSVGPDTTTSEPVTTSGPASMSPAEVASALAEGIRAGEVSESDLEVLRDALETGGGSSNSLEVRIDHLQNEVADLKAYSDALEEFIDENGEARTLMRDLQEGVEGVRNDVAEVEDQVESVSGEVESVSGEVESVSEEVESVSGEVTAATERIDGLDDEVSRIDDIESSVDSVEGSVDELESSLSGVDEQIGSLQEEMDAIRDEVDDVRDEIPEGRIEAIDDRMDEFQAELEELAQMRQRMASVFGGMGGGGEAAGVGAETDDSDEAEEADESGADADETDEE